MPTHWKQAVKKEKRRVKKEFKFKEFGDKALDFLDNANAPFNILDGAIRSGKTISSSLKWLEFVGKHPDDEFLMSGKTRTSLYRNVLRDIMAMMEGLNIEYEHRPNDAMLIIEDNTNWLVGFAHEGISDIIRGMTIAGWNADETNLYPKNTVDEALDRLSLEGARAYWTMNPASPHHYIYKDYITNNEMKKTGELQRYHFTLYDNPNLSKDYIKRLELRYPPGTVGYKRKILGLWVVAEGIIYDTFVPEQHTFTNNPYQNYDKYYLTTDYGASNMHAIGLMGIKYTNKGNEYNLLDEFIWDMNNQTKSLTDEALAKKGIELLKNNNIKKFDGWFTPHDASSFRATLREKTYNTYPIPVLTHKPDTLNDIQEIQALFNTGMFKISTKCETSISQGQTYSWDPKAQQRGEDKPLKIDDHCPDMWRGAIIGSRNLNTEVYKNRSKTYYDYSRTARKLKNTRRRR